MFDLSGRIALVTGAGQGVGAAIAAALADQGATVLVNDLSEERAARCVEGIGRTGGRAEAAVADVTDREAVDALVQRAARRFGPVDILVNNAGVPADGLGIRHFVETDPADWPALVDLNLNAVLHCAHTVVPAMIERRWGRVVTIVSDAGRVGEAGIAVYAAAKAGAAGFARALAKEVGRFGVTSNCVSLGAIQPEDMAVDDVARRARHYPMRRLGRADDVAPAVVWLSSDEAGWVTGQTLSVSGGYVTC